MPNIKSAMKRVVTSEKRNVRNTAKKSTLKTLIKKTTSAIEAKDSSAEELLLKTCCALDKASASNLMHKNASAHKKSQLTKAYNASKA